jgi:hypothetical protein
LKKDTTPLFHISRNFVEFGAFTAVEVASFRERGILGDRDYVRAAESPDWLPVGNWLAEAAAELVKPKPAAKTKTAAARKRATPAAKSPKKAA